MKVSLSKYNTEQLYQGSQSIGAMNMGGLSLSPEQESGAVTTLSPSQLANKALARYFSLLKESMPHLPAMSWTLLANAYNGYCQFGLHDIERLIGGVMDDAGIEYEVYENLLRQGEKLSDLDWSDDEARERRSGDYQTRAYYLITTLTFAEKVAVAEVIERLWDDSPRATSLVEIIARITHQHPDNVFMGSSLEFKVLGREVKEGLGASIEIVRLGIEGEAEESCYLDFRVKTRTVGSRVQFEWTRPTVRLPEHFSFCQSDIVESAERSLFKLMAAS